MHRVQFSTPAPALEEFVRFYIQRDVSIHGSAVVHPIPARPTPMIVFDFDDPTDVLYYAQPAIVRSPSSVVVGPQTYRRMEMQLRGTLNTFAIVFQPDGIQRLFSVPMQELINHDFEAHSVLGTFITSLGERLGNSPSLKERAKIVEEALLPRALSSTSVDGVSAAANQIILSGGRAGVPALAVSAGLSVRQFERTFLKKVGMRPKLLIRIARFEAALEDRARCSAKSWTQVAHEFGYYDQMHMIHDFAEFTGATPTDTLTQLENIFLEQIRAIRSPSPSIDPGHNSRFIL